MSNWWFLNAYHGLFSECVYDPVQVRRRRRIKIVEKMSLKYCLQMIEEKILHNISRMLLILKLPLSELIYILEIRIWILNKKPCENPLGVFYIAEKIWNNVKIEKKVLELCFVLKKSTLTCFLTRLYILIL